MRYRNGRWLIWRGRCPGCFLFALRAMELCSLTFTRRLINRAGPSNVNWFSPPFDSQMGAESRARTHQKHTRRWKRTVLTSLAAGLQPQTGSNEMLEGLSVSPSAQSVCEHQTLSQHRVLSTGLIRNNWSSMRNSLTTVCFPAARSELALPKCAFKPVEIASVSRAHWDQWCHCEGKGCVLNQTDCQLFPDPLSLWGRSQSCIRLATITHRAERVCVHNAWRQRGASSTWFDSIFHTVPLLICWALFSCRLVSRCRQITSATDYKCIFCWIKIEQRPSAWSAWMWEFVIGNGSIRQGFFSEEACILFILFLHILHLLAQHFSWSWDCSVYVTSWRKYLRHESLKLTVNAKYWSAVK